MQRHQKDNAKKRKRNTCVEGTFVRKIANKFAFSLIYSYLCRQLV